VHELSIINPWAWDEGADGDQDAYHVAQLHGQEGTHYLLGELNLGVQDGHGPPLYTVHQILINDKLKLLNGILIGN
jgi:hypothetical protein